MKVVEVDGFEFCFTDAIDAFVFDEKDKTKPTFHGAPMKAVDIVAEFEESYLYVELKDHRNPSKYDEYSTEMDDEIHTRRHRFNQLKNGLKYKLRDSYLYRHAENKVEKPVHYICLITFDNALNSRMRDCLRSELPVGRVSLRWVKAFVESCNVVNLDKWNENFPKWYVKRLD